LEQGISRIKVGKIAVSLPGEKIAISPFSFQQPVKLGIFEE